jgi:hypothetical protein
MESASRRRIQWRRNIALSDSFRAHSRSFSHRDGRNQRLCVWHEGTIVELRCGGKFYDLAEVHDSDPIRDVLYSA